jgi:hypothetical protein
MRKRIKPLSQVNILASSHGTHDGHMLFGLGRRDRKQAKVELLYKYFLLQRYHEVRAKGGSNHGI